MEKKFPSIPPISVYDVKELCSGLTTEALAVFAGISDKARADNLFVTLTFNPSMVAALEFKSLDDRNFVLNGLR